MNPEDNIDWLKEEYQNQTNKLKILTRRVQTMQEVNRNLSSNLRHVKLQRKLLEEENELLKERLKLR